VSSADEPEPPVTVDSPALDRWPTFALDYHVETHADGTRCTIRPRDDPDGRWVAADDAGYVALDEIR
jgi:hypothetical protein